MLEIQNHGALIVSSNYWDSEAAKAGKVLVSPNAGAIRVLLPRAMRPMIEECRSCKYAVLSRGPWLDKGVEEGIEILFEDGTDNPYVLHLTPASFVMLPAEPEAGKEWLIALWDLKKGKPHKALERICHWRRVPKIPWLKAWQGGKPPPGRE